MAKNIMNPAEICTTLRLPTRVKAKRPAFSLLRHKGKSSDQSGSSVIYLNKVESCNSTNVK